MITRRKDSIRLLVWSHEAHAKGEPYDELPFLVPERLEHKHEGTSLYLRSCTEMLKDAAGSRIL